MKKLLTILGVLIIGALVFTSCVKKPECETNNYGDVTVRNSAGGTIMVDVTWGSYTFNDERILHNGQSTTYTRVPAGSIKVWGNGGYGWDYSNSYLYSCEDYLFTWYGFKDAPADYNEFAGIGILTEDFVSKQK